MPRLDEAVACEVRKDRVGYGLSSDLCQCVLTENFS